MAKVFLSYSRRSRQIAETIEGDIRNADHTVWFDKRIPAGQKWWSRILVEIRQCDVFVFVVDRQSLSSDACKRERSYATQLSKPILPIVVDKDVTPALLSDVSTIQFVDYRKRDADAALRLGTVLGAVGPAPPLPDPLPEPPAVPLSPLSDLAERAESVSLSSEQLAGLVHELTARLSSPDSLSDARALLGELRRRAAIPPDLAATIDTTLAATAPITWRNRFLLAVIGAVIGFAVLTLSAGLAPPSAYASNWLRAGALCGVMAGIAAFFTGRRRKRIFFSLCGGAVGVALGIALAWADPKVAAFIPIPAFVGLLGGSLIGVTADRS